MSVVIHRNACDPGGFVHTFLNWNCLPMPPNVAMRVSDGIGGKLRDVTWDEVMELRRDRQRRRLDHILRESEPSIVPCYVWTFFNEQDFPYHGWYCYTVTRYNNGGHAVNFKGFDHELAFSIMREIPLGFLPIKDSFYDWMAAFAERFPRTSPNDPRKAGSKIGWLIHQKTFSLNRPQNS